MIIEVDTVKGFQDFLPPESLKRAEVKKAIEKYFKLYGFLPVETPVVEFDELMKQDSLQQVEEDEAISNRFRLKDRGGRNLGLRYEFTFQLGRIFKQNPNIKMPFRKYQIGENFRDEPIGPGRFRQFTQCDADIIGDSSIDCEVDLLAMTSDILKDLKIGCEIQVNNRKLINAIIESVEIKDAKSVMKELDKLDKIGEDQVKSNLRKYADANQILTLFKLVEKDLSFFINNAFDGAEELKALAEKANKYGIKLKLNNLLMRGFSYYTGNIFEIIGEDKIAIGGGGRYDNLVGKYVKRSLPAVGISFGLERVCNLAKIPMPSAIKAVLISIGQENTTVKLARKLRKEEVSCFVYADKIGKALEYANSYEVPFAVFIGEDEVKKKKFKLRDMTSGKEENMTERQLISFLKKVF